MQMIGLPVHYQHTRELACGCGRSVTRYDFATVTELQVADGCPRHDPDTPNRRQGMSRALRFHVLKRDDFTCQYCGRRAPDVALEVDHIVPVAKGGVSEIANLTTACEDCNRGKRDT